YAKEVEDYELKSALKVAKEYKDKIFEFKDISDKFYNAWKNRVNNGFLKRRNEILFLTTAHTAKGLEWDRVTIADDFTDFADLIVDFSCDSLKEFQDEQNYLPNQELLDEFNLFYVAITRAKKELVKDSENFHYLMAKNMDKLIDNRIKETKQDIENSKSNTSNKNKKASKMEFEDKQILRQQRNQEDGKAKNSGLKWSLEDKIKAKSMFNKNSTITQIANKLERTEGAILGELIKSEVITKSEQIKLTQILSSNSNNAVKSILTV
ncbi:MAG: 3'-5' exonuclease, partial [Campylobacterota bacterium]|nr:3'-5' exonuclease [Campylobacterota bacterium]